MATAPDQGSSLPAGVQGGNPPAGDVPSAPRTAGPEGAIDQTSSAFEQAAQEVLSGNADNLAPANPYEHRGPEVQPPPPPPPTESGPPPTPFTAPSEGRAATATTVEGPDDDFAAPAGRAEESARGIEEFLRNQEAQRQATQPPQPQNLTPEGAELSESLRQSGYNVPQGQTDGDLAAGFMNYLDQQRQPNQQENPQIAQLRQQAQDAQQAAHAAQLSAAQAQHQRPAQTAEPSIGDWRDYTQVDEAGNQQLRPGLDPRTSAAVLDAARSEQQVQRDFARDPRGTIQQHYGDEVRREAAAIARQVTDEGIGELRDQMQARTLIDQNAGWIFQQDQYGGRQKDTEGRPVLTTAGNMVHQRVKQLADQGINDPETQFQLAMQLAETDYRRAYDQYAYNLAQQSVQQQNGNGNGQAQAAQQQQMQQQPQQQQATPSAPAQQPSVGVNEAHKQNFISQYANQQMQQQAQAGDLDHAPAMGAEIARAADPNQPPVDPTEAFRSMAMGLASQGGLVRGRN